MPMNTYTYGSYQKYVQFWPGNDFTQTIYFRVNVRQWFGIQSRPRVPKWHPDWFTGCGSLSFHDESQMYTYPPYASSYIMKGTARDIPYIELFEVASKDKSSNSLEQILRLAQVRFNSDTGLGETLIEGQDAFRMVTRRVKTALDAIRLIKKGKWKQAAKLLNNTVGSNISSKNWKPRPVKSLLDIPSSVWLEFQFGWKPLIQSVHDSIETLNNNAPKNEKTATARTDKDDRQDVENNNQYRSGVGAQVVNQQIANLNALGLTNPALLAWNVLPFSFILDWFFPIAEMLKRLSMGFGLSVIHQWYSKRSQVSLYNRCALGDLRYERQVRYERNMVDPFDLPMMMRNTVGFGKALTGLALIQQLR